MKKEMLVAVVIGFTLGLLITFGLYRLRVSQQRKPDAPTVEPTATTTASPTDRLITIHNPKEGAVQKEKSATITGSTIPNAYIVLLVNEAEYIRNADAEGNFSFDVELEEGSNVLIVQVVTEVGQLITKERTVVVTSLYEEPITEIETATPSAKPTPTSTPTPRPSAKPSP